LNINPGILYEIDIHILEDITSVKENTNKPDHDISVINYPNPFNSSTNFAITIPSSQKYRQKQINIYNALGQKINSIALSNQLLEQWDGKDYTGKAAATGIYYYQLVMDNRIYKSGSMILLK
jgi:flagellar hook assembly protein FlgD